MGSGFDKTRKVVKCQKSDQASSRLTHPLDDRHWVWHGYRRCCSFLHLPPLSCAHLSKASFMEQLVSMQDQALSQPSRSLLLYALAAHSHNLMGVGYTSQTNLTSINHPTIHKNFFTLDALENESNHSHPFSPFSSFNLQFLSAHDIFTLYCTIWRYFLAPGYSSSPRCRSVTVGMLS